jgi:tetratricopeptide (TPR) repeat protein
MLNEAATRLRALGRLTEALEPMRATIEFYPKNGVWIQAAQGASNLSELELTLGEVTGAVEDSEQSVTYAHRSGDAFQKQTVHVILADALHQAGRRAEAEARFRGAEQMQAERQPNYLLLYSGAGFRYCDLLLAGAERAAWQMKNAERGMRNADLIDSCRVVSQRATQTLDWFINHFVNATILDIALDHLTLGRAAVYEAILEDSDFRLLTSTSRTSTPPCQASAAPARRTTSRAASSLAPGCEV